MVANQQLNTVEIYSVSALHCPATRVRGRVVHPRPVRRAFAGTATEGVWAPFGDDAEFYSERKATTGFTRLASRLGNQTATKATNENNDL